MNLVPTQNDVRERESGNVVDVLFDSGQSHVDDHERRRMLFDRKRFTGNRIVYLVLLRGVVFWRRWIIDLEELSDGAFEVGQWRNEIRYCKAALEPLPQQTLNRIDAVKQSVASCNS
jgi:hypothetical protein